MKRSLYWLTNDLRVNDNIALNLASQSDMLLCVYVVDKSWFQANNYQAKPLGSKRWHFLQDCLIDFNQQLLALGQQLYIVYGDTLSSLTNLCQQYEITNVITTRLPGTYENNVMTQLSHRFPQVAVNKVEQFTLFNQDLLPFELEQLPVSYSKFKKAMVDVVIPAVIPAISALPSPSKSMPSPTIFRPPWLPDTPYQESKRGVNFVGGEKSALNHLNHYFSGDLPANYQQVRNSLDGWDNSSKLSPWLGYGCISARQVITALADFESEHGKNKSTDCLYLELLWREYFQWLHYKVGSKMYQFKGLAKQPPLTSFYAERFTKWCLGTTPYPLVNACMHELSETGYLSNRGRQIVASCLVNELSVDWRFGAAWFEEHLIDYDVAVNWGNWQYIAGVGVDPRGGRHFNIAKQSALYDADGVYTAKWFAQSDSAEQSSSANYALDSVDASDWPVSSHNHLKNKSLAHISLANKSLASDNDS